MVNRTIREFDVLDKMLFERVLGEQVVEKIRLGVLHEAAKLFDNSEPEIPIFKPEGLLSATEHMKLIEARRELKANADLENYEYDMIDDWNDPNSEDDIFYTCPQKCFSIIDGSRWVASTGMWRIIKSENELKQFLACCKNN